MIRLLAISFLMSAGTTGLTQAQTVPAVPPVVPVVGLPAPVPPDSMLQTLAGPIRDVMYWGAGSTTKVSPLITVLPALSRVAGVQTTPYSGVPGAWATVRIRGVTNVIGNAQPLYVVDGVPVYNTEVAPEYWSVYNYTPTSPLSTVATPHTAVANPLLELPMVDVEKLEVIQSAAGTARYGMQGTNGVILISTRRGGNGPDAPRPLRVRYAGWAGVQQVRQRYDLLDAQQFAGLANAAAVNQGRAQPFPAAG